MIQSVRRLMSVALPYSWSAASWQIVAVALVAYWFQRLPSPGKAAAAGAVAAAVMAVRANLFTRGEQIGWILIAAAFAVIEIRAISADREIHDKEQFEASNRQEEDFQAVLRKNQEQFDATMSRFTRLGDLAETSIKTITGGDSYCWLAFSYTEPTQILFSAVHSGDYPLRDVDITIRDIDLYQKTQKTRPITISEFLDLAKTRVHLNYIAPHGAIVIGPYPINEDGQNFDIQFSSPIGSWSELLQRRKVNGKWAIAMKVTRWTVERGKLRPHDLRYRIDPAYPKVNGKVEWR